MQLSRLRILVAILCLIPVLPSIAEERRQERDEHRAQGQVADPVAATDPAFLADETPYWTKGSLEPRKQVAERAQVAMTLSIATLIFGAVVIAGIGFLGLRGILSSEQTFKLIGLSFVVAVGVFLIPAGYNQAQIAPTAALLGTIAGYLFGRPRDEPHSKSEETVSTKKGRTAS